MFVKKYGDICVSIFFLVVGIALIIGARAFPKSAVVEIGPDFMPTVIGVIIVLLSAILLAQSIKGLKAAVAKAEAEGPDDSDYKRVSSLILSLVYVFVLQPVGFIISTFVYLFGQIFVLAPDEKRTKKDIILYLIIDVVFVLVVFFLFRYGFKIVLPAGIFTINL